MQDSRFEGSIESQSSKVDSQNQIFPKALEEKMKTPNNIIEHGSFSCGTDTVGKLTPLKFEYSVEVEDEI